MYALLRLFPAWRESGWTPITQSDYASLWQRFGGSVMTHPEIVRRLSDIAGIPVRYLGRSHQNSLVGGLACWGGYLALSKEGLKRAGKKRMLDLGNAEFIFPFASDASIQLRFAGSYIASLHQHNIPNLRPQKETLAMVRREEDYSKKFLYNQRRELRLFLEDGGRSEPIENFSGDTLAGIYRDLFERRWGFDVPGKTRLSEVFRAMRPFMMGSVLLHQDRAIAFQLIYHVHSPQWLSVEYINGGVDPDYRNYSPGSILSYLNIQAARKMADETNKTLRYSFGRADREYKMRWCNPQTVYRT